MARQPVELASHPGANQPPRFDTVIPQEFNRPQIDVKHGARLEITFAISDPEGQPLSVRALGLPEGAEFSQETWTLRWTPRPDQVGLHALRVAASDGVAETSRALAIRVVENRAPVIIAAAHSRVPVGQPWRMQLAITDPDGDPLNVELVGLPKDATHLERENVVTWTPGEDQVGRVYRVTVKASDGQFTTTHQLTLEPVELSSDSASSRHRWQSFLLPGGGYSVYTPRDGSIGTFHGVTLEMLIAAWIHRTNNRGPSHGRLYVNAELTNSTRGESPIMFTYNFGTSLSFERNPTRLWLIPFYGVDLGGIIHDDLGTHFQTTPHAGVHVFSSPNLFVNVRGGYRLVPGELERLGGFHGAATLDFSVW